MTRKFIRVATAHTRSAKCTGISVLIQDEPDQLVGRASERDIVSALGDHGRTALAT